MEAIYHQLHVLLRAEIELHEELSAELEREAAQDGALDSAALIRLQALKQDKVRQIQALESDRIHLVCGLAEAWGEPKQDITLRAIIARAPARWATPFQECFERLQALVRRIRESARLTAGNAQARLKAIEATLAVIHEAIKAHSTYSEEGRLQQRTPTLKHTSA